MAAKTIFLVLAAAWLLVSGCGWERKAVFFSPSHQNSIVILQPHLMNIWGLKLKAVSRDGVVFVKDFTPNDDVFVNFYHVTWDPTSTIVGVFASGGGYPYIQFAFDFKVDRPIPFASMRDAVARDIRKKYHLSKNEDPFLCRPCIATFIREHPAEITR